MYTSQELVPISALQHYLYCPRQCALIHLELIWTENVFTAEGRLLHEKADSGKVEVRGDIKTATGLLLRSTKLGLVGRADVVEFHRVDRADVVDFHGVENNSSSAKGQKVKASSNKIWQPFPVEYKRGKPKKHDADKVQLCAQAICLEEMLNISVPCGALFYGKTRRRLEVVFDDALRVKTAQTAANIHALFEKGVTPAPFLHEGCAACSLVEDCMPKTVDKKQLASNYLEKVRREE